jgi:putative ABC transport system permease protein
VEIAGEMKPLDFRLADVHTDFDFLKTMEIPMIAGRDFNSDLASDYTEAFIINEAAVQAIGYNTNDEAVGKKINYSDRSGFITGVVKDFHFESLKQEIAPVIFMITGGRGGSLVLKLNEEMEQETITYLQEQWSYLRPGSPFSYYFVDARFNELYEDDEKVAELVSYFSVIAVIIGVLGLYGLASFTAEQRFKEIGIRKVMGATVTQILLLLTRGFTYLVLIGFVLAVPIAWYFMNMWLKTFAYHNNIDLFSVALAGGVAIIVAWITVGIQTWKAANTNPVDTIRNE